MPSSEVKRRRRTAARAPWKDVVGRRVEPALLDVVDVRQVDGVDVPVTVADRALGFVGRGALPVEALVQAGVSSGTAKVWLREGRAAEVRLCARERGERELQGGQLRPVRLSPRERVLAWFVREVERQAARATLAEVEVVGRLARGEVESKVVTAKFEPAGGSGGQAGAMVEVERTERSTTLAPSLQAVKYRMEIRERATWGRQRHDDEPIDLTPGIGPGGSVPGGGGDELEQVIDRIAERIADVAAARAGQDARAAAADDDIVDAEVVDDTDPPDTADTALPAATGR